MDVTMEYVEVLVVAVNPQVSSVQADALIYISSTLVEYLIAFSFLNLYSAC